MEKIYKDMLKNNKSGISINEELEENILIITIWANKKYVDTFEKIYDIPKYEEIEEDIKIYLYKEVEKLVKTIKEIIDIEVEIQEDNDIIRWAI